jgi:hypothetical protein
MKSSQDDPYNLTFETRSDYVYAIARGDLSPDHLRVHAWGRIIARCREDKRDKLLILLESPRNDSPAGTYRSSVQTAEARLFHGIKIAIADLNQEHLETNRFYQLVASNRGAVMKAFTSEADALEWLLP